METAIQQPPPTKDKPKVKPIDLFTALTESLDQLGIQYTWDADFDDIGLLVINSNQHFGKAHQVGFTIGKETGQLLQVGFRETHSWSDGFMAEAQQKEVSI